MASNDALNVPLGGATGTGNFVGATSPTLITPVLGVATGTSLNLGSSTTITGVINDNAMATASSAKAATSSSIKSYIDTLNVYKFIGAFGGTSIPSIDFTGLSTSAYQIYYVEVQLLSPVTNAVTLELRTSTNNGVAWDSSAGNYAWAGSSSTSAAVSAIGSTSDTSLGLTAATVNSSSQCWVSGWIRVMMNNATGNYTQVISQLTYSNTTGVSNVTLAQVSGQRSSTTATNAFQLIFSSGNLASGFAKLYGITV